MDNSRSVKTDDNNIHIDNHDKRRHENRIQRNTFGQSQPLLKMVQSVENVYTKYKTKKVTEYSKTLFQEDKNMTSLKKWIVAFNEDLTKGIPLLPSASNSMVLPVEQLYTNLSIREENSPLSKRCELSLNEQSQRVSAYDMFCFKGLPNRNVILIGDAGYGKTTFCLWLLKQWCDAKQFSNSPLNEWADCLDDFDFVFYINNDFGNESRGDFDKSLYKEICYAATKSDHSCVIIADGLENFSQNLVELRNLASGGKDVIDRKIIFLCTIRPSQFESLAAIGGEFDKVLKIQGLEENGFELITENILTHHYHLQNENLEAYEEILGLPNDKSMKSLTNIPMLAVLSAMIYFEKEYTRCSNTSLYEEMLKMLIERDKSQRKGYSGNKGILYQDGEIREALGENMEGDCINADELLSSLHKLAYKCIASNQVEQKFVFSLEVAQKTMGELNFKFAEKVGLISIQYSLEDREVCFLHSSIRDFLAAMHIVDEVQNSFCNNLTNVMDIFGLSSVIKFICGMCPSLGKAISKRVADLTNGDKTFCQYRESLYQCSRVSQLFQEHMKWYREMKYGATETRTSLYLADIYLDDESNPQDIAMTSRLLQDEDDMIKSIFVHMIHTDLKHVNEKVQFCEIFRDRTFLSLEGLYIKDKAYGFTFDTISAPSLKTLHLQQLLVKDTELGARNKYPLLKNTPMLQKLKLMDITLNGRDLGLTPDMSHINEIELHRVYMTQDGWENLVQSLFKIPTEFTVVITDTDIDDKSSSTIRSSKLVSIILHNQRTLVFKKNTKPKKY